MQEPLSPIEAKNLVLVIREGGAVSFSKHALIAFRSREELVIVTAWRDRS